MNRTSQSRSLKKSPRILLSSVFGPYAQDDDFGSRKINPMELYQNQVTRTQGAFSLRMFHRSFGLMLIQANLDVPTTLLDFPSRERFIEELKTQKYDIIGLSGIIPNIKKITEMCKLIREHQPKARIVVGGHISNLGGIEERIDADHIVRGEGVRWFREFLGMDPDAPINHPEAYSGFGARTMGYQLSDKPGDTAAILLPSVGCPLGCNFCSTSALFGGKGNSIHFYNTGDELFEVMLKLEKKLKVDSFFVMDENFLFYRERALRLLELMKEHNKSWSMYIFSSARVLKSYSMEQLLGLGISWVWMGLEGENSQYSKLNNINTKELINELQDNGIRVLGSSIIGLENHTPENIQQVIDYAVSHDTVFHQFMLYTTNPGTPLHKEHQEKGTLLSEDEIEFADSHGQYRFNYRHPHIQNGQEGQYLLDAFDKDFAKNGPSMLRLFRVTMNGYMKHRNHPDERIRSRFLKDVNDLKYVYAPATWAIKRYYRHDAGISARANGLLNDMYKTFGWSIRLLNPFAGIYLRFAIRKEEKMLATERAYEPATFYEMNLEAQVLTSQASESYGLTDTGMIALKDVIPQRS